jgi:ribosomal protein S12 methylthiotransferase
VIIDRQEGDYWIGRTEFDSPEVDNEVLIPISAKLNSGDFYNVLITNANEYDLIGEVKIDE